MREIVNLMPYFVTIFICVILLDACYSKLNNLKLILNKKNIFIILVTAVVTIANNFYNNNELKTLFSLIILCINFKLIYKKDFKNIVISYIMIFLILITLEITITTCLSTLNILVNNSAAVLINYTKLELTLVINLIEYIIFSIKPIKLFLRKTLTFFINNSSIGNLTYLMFITTTILGMLSVKNFSSNNSSQFLICLIIIFVILFAVVIKAKTNELILKSSNEKLIKYNDKYGKFLDEYKIYKHNINYKLSSMKAYGNKRINALIDDLLEEETSFSIKNNNLYNVPNGIKGIVAEKLYNTNIDVLIDNKIKKDPFKSLSAKAFNSFSESLGIVLDNAIEASEETENPIVTVDLYENEEKIFVKVGNNFCNSIDIDDIGTKYYSTKNRGSGLGLFSIMRNNLIKEKINIINDFYYIELQIKKAR